ncbi:MAG: M6 family metalloprotease domain-containing protein, partial [Fibrobacteria bacterium]|nr:M6 family metalloprotease domain-containing protein [Fibrobacteria bacterium]
MVFFSRGLTRPINGELFEIRQPDETKVSVRVWGDEFYREIETPDGYTLIKDPNTGWLCYAKLSQDQDNYISTGIQYTSNTVVAPEVISGVTKHLRISTKAVKAKQDSIHKAMGIHRELPPHMPGSVPSLRKVSASPDTIVGLTIPLDFPEEKAAVNRQYIDDMYNKTGFGNYGCVRDYYEEVSGGKFVYINIVVDFVTLSQSKAYYDAAQSRVQTMATEALTTLRNRGFDFNRVSISGGKIVGINLMYAGEPESMSSGLWPHQNWYTGGFSASGISPNKFQITNLGKSVPVIGTVIHENGHMLFDWPDLYSYTNQFIGAGDYCLMSLHSSTTPMINPYFRYLQGWLEFTELNFADPGTIFTAIANSNHVYSFWGSTISAYELYYVEARRKEGRSADLPDEGLLIWHVNTQGSNSNGVLPFYVSVVQADAKYELENGLSKGGGPGDLFHAGYNDAFNDNTSPSAKWDNGKNSGYNINHISPVGGHMFFRWGNSNDPFIRLSFPYDGAELEQNSQYLLKWITNSSKRMNIELFKDDSLVLVIDSSAAADSSFSWKVPLSLKAGDDYHILLKTTDEVLSDTLIQKFSVLKEFRIDSYPYSQNFDEFSSGTFLQDNWSQSKTDAYDWYVYQGKTPSRFHPGGGGTGPEDDHTSGNGENGKYVYVEATRNISKRRGDILSPKFNLSNLNNAELTFWTHMFSTTGNIGHLYLDLSVDGKWTNGIIHLEGDQGDKWIKQTLDLTPYAKKRVIFRFRGVTGTDWAGDIAMDDFMITGEMVVGNTFTSQKTLPMYRHGNLLYLPGNRDFLSLYDIKGKV